MEEMREEGEKMRKEEKRGLVGFQGEKGDRLCEGSKEERLEE